MANKQPIDPGIISAVVQGVRTAVGRYADAWFGPGGTIRPVPSQPAEQASVLGRQFDFPVNVNSQTKPRSGDDGGVSFAQMRALADGYDLLRLIIERRKDQVAKLRWGFGLKPEVEKVAKAKKLKAAHDEARTGSAKVPAAEPEGASAKPGADGPDKQQPEDQNAAVSQPPMAPALPEPEPEDPRIGELREFFQFPDQENDWDTWLRMLLEDMLVIDAATIYPRMTLGGDLYSLEPVDGATIKRVIDESGRTPVPPDCAYQQVLKGVPASEYNRDELIYRARNRRTNKLYGYSPVEQIIMTVNIALRRQVHQLQYYTEGNVPEMIFGVPDTWNPDQVKQFQTWWDTLMEGNTAERRHAKFVPGGVKPFPTKDAALKDEYDEWLARIVCFAFSIDPTPFVKQTNRATAESSMSQALAEGLQPVMNWIKNTVDMIVWKYFGYKDLEFKWEREDEVGGKEQAETLKTLKDGGFITDDEGREKLGYEPKTEGQRAAEKAAQPPVLVAPDGGPAPGKAPAAPLAKAARPVRKLARNRRAQQSARAAVEKAFASAFAATTLSAASAVRALGKASAPVRAKADRAVASVDFSIDEAVSIEVTDVLAASRADGFKAAGIQVKAKFSDAQFDQANDRAVAWAEARVAELVSDVEDATREMLRGHIAAALEDGATNDEIADSLEEFYGFSPARAEAIARTETADADVAGNLDAYKEAGADGKEWVSQGENCDACQELDGQVVGIDEEFAPGVDGPTLHPNCECDVLPVFYNEEAA